MAVGRCALLALAALAVVIVPMAAAQGAGSAVCKRDGVETYANELCRCKKAARYCNPYCEGTYIQCGANGEREIKACDAGKLFSIITGQCESLPKDAPGVCPGLPDTVGSAKDDPKPCTTPFCACDDLSVGNHPNPFDPSKGSYIICEFIPGLAPGIKSQIKQIVECPVGQVYDAVTSACRPAPPGSPAALRPGSQACTGLGCFCRGRKRGLYLNPLDSDRATAVRCNSKGVTTSLLLGAKDQYFNGKRFVKLPPGGLPPLCVLDSSGLRATGRGLKEAWDDMLNAPALGAPTPLFRNDTPLGAVVGSSNSSTPTTGSGGGRPPAAPANGRKLQQSFVSNCPGANFATGCGTIVSTPCWVVTGNPCRGWPNGIAVLYKCAIYKCGGGCPAAWLGTYTPTQCARLGGPGVAGAID